MSLKTIKLGRSEYVISTEQRTKKQSNQSRNQNLRGHSRRIWQGFGCMGLGPIWVGFGRLGVWIGLDLFILVGLGPLGAQLFQVFWPLAFFGLPLIDSLSISAPISLDLGLTHDCTQALFRDMMPSKSLFLVVFVFSKINKFSLPFRKMKEDELLM